MIKNSIINTVFSILVILIGLISQIFLSRYFTVEEFGTYQLIWTWLQLFSFVALNSFNFVVVKSVAQDYPEFFKPANIYCFLSSLVGSAAFLIVGFFFRPELLDYFILLAILFPFHSGINLSVSYFTGKSNFLYSSLITLSIQFFSSLLQIILLLMYKSVFLALLVALLITAIVNISTTLYINNKLHQPSDKVKDKALVKFGLQLSLMQFIPSIAQRLQFIILEAFTSIYTLSIYAVAQMFPRYTIQIIEKALAPVRVYIASITPALGNKLLRKAFVLIILGSLILSLLIGASLPFFVELIFGDKYISSINYSVLLMSMLIFLPYNITVNNYLLFHNYKAVFLKTTLSFSILQILLFLITIPFYEIYGIIISILIARLSLTILQFWWINKQTIVIKEEYLTLEKCYEKNALYITNKFQGVNVLKVIQADYLNSTEKYPLWIKIIAKLSSTKYDKAKFSKLLD